MRVTIVVILGLLPAAAAAPPEVVVVRPVEKELADQIDVTGQVTASTTVEVRARVRGFVEKVLFEEGSTVKKGDILYQVDDRAARAGVTKAEADLARVEARLKAADADYQRTLKLAERDLASKEEVDRAAAAVQAARAEVQFATAGVKKALLDLEQTRITAPIDGRIGRTLVDAGNLVGQDHPTLLATIVVLDPIHVTFDLAERDLPRVARRLREGDEPKPRLPVRVRTAADGEFRHEGTLDTLESAVDPSRRAIQARAVLPNPKGDLLPGLFVHVRIPLGPSRKVLAIADRSVVRTGDRAQVLVVGDRNVLGERPVKVGPLVDGLRVIEEGLKPDDWVVSDPRGRQAGDEIAPKRATTAPTEEPVGAPGPTAVRRAQDFPTTGPALIVSAVYPGANAATVEDVVAAPIGVQLDGLAGVVSRLAVCSNTGDMRMTLAFKPGTDLDAATAQVRERLARAEPTLPDLVRRQGVTVRPRPVYLLAVAVLSPENRYDRTFLARYAAERVRDELFKVTGVAEATPYGDAEPAAQLRIDLDRDRLRAFNLTAADVAPALRLQNLRLTEKDGLIVSEGRPLEVEQIEKLIIKTTDGGKAIYLRDVARVESVSVVTTATSVDGKASAILLVARLPGANGRATAKAIRTRLAGLAKDAPAGIELRVIDGPEGPAGR